MKNLKIYIAATIFAAMAAFTSCKKDNVQPVKVTTLQSKTLADSTGTDQPPIPPK